MELPLTSTSYFFFGFYVQESLVLKAPHFGSGFLCRCLIWVYSWGVLFLLGLSIWFDFQVKWHHFLHMHITHSPCKFNKIMASFIFLFKADKEVILKNQSRKLLHCQNYFLWSFPRFNFYIILTVAVVVDFYHWNEWENDIIVKCHVFSALKWLNYN